jgi:hypothetical protein
VPRPVHFELVAPQPAVAGAGSAAAAAAAAAGAPPRTAERA